MRSLGRVFRSIDHRNPKRAEGLEPTESKPGQTVFVRDYQCVKVALGEELMELGGLIIHAGANFLDNSHALVPAGNGVLPQSFRLGIKCSFML